MGVRQLAHIRLQHRSGRPGGRDALKKAVAAYRTHAVLGVPDEDLAAANAAMQRRRDETLRQLDDLPVVRPAGTWSLLAAAGDRSRAFR